MYEQPNLSINMHEPDLRLLYCYTEDSTKPVYVWASLIIIDTMTNIYFYRTNEDRIIDVYESDTEQEIALGGE